MGVVERARGCTGCGPSRTPESSKCVGAVDGYCEGKRAPGEPDADSLGVDRRREVGREMLRVVLVWWVCGRRRMKVAIDQNEAGNTESEWVREGSETCRERVVSSVAREVVEASKDRSRVVRLV